MRKKRDSFLHARRRREASLFCPRITVSLLCPFSPLLIFIFSLASSFPHSCALRIQRCDLITLLIQTVFSVLTGHFQATVSAVSLCNYLHQYYYYD